MSFRVMTMPDEPELLAKWLEQQLVGDRLRDLVEELAAVHGSGSGGTPLCELWMESLSRVLHRGLSALDEAQIRLLLTRPRYLIELQELVFTGGGEYWRTVTRPASLEAAVQHRWRELAGQLQRLEPIVPLQKVRKHRRPNPWLVMVSTAAAVLMAVVAVDRFRTPSTPMASTGWGWSKPDALPKQGDAKGYFDALANGGQAWFDKRPETRPEFAKRLNELRQGCSVVILAEHPVLNDDQRRWLKERCQTWAAKFDAALAKLEAGGDLEGVRLEVDGVVLALVDSLRSRAALL